MAGTTNLISSGHKPLPESSEVLPGTTEQHVVPLTVADPPRARPDLRAALKTITPHVEDYVAHARLAGLGENVTHV
jgi:hypothetical protein